MRRFFVEEIKGNKDQSFTIVGPEARHISRVLRMSQGDRFILMDREGNRFQALIIASDPREVRVFLEEALPVPKRSPVEIILCQALLKSGPMDYMIQKTSELGVDKILPFACSRTVVRVRGDRLSNKIRHWREICLSAAKQSGRSVPAEIGPPVPFEELINAWKGQDAVKAILWEEEGSKDLKGLLRQYPRPGRFVCIVGPEGGFDKKEVKAAGKAGFISASLGNRILRGETAALAMVAIVQYEWGDLCIREG